MNEVLEKYAELIAVPSHSFDSSQGGVAKHIVHLQSAVNDMAAEIKRLEAERTEPADPEPPPDLNALAAKEMGWVSEPARGSTGERHLIYRNADGQYQFWVTAWQPIENLDQAMQVASQRAKNSTDFSFGFYRFREDIGGGFQVWARRESADSPLLEAIAHDIDNVPEALTKLCLQDVGVIGSET